MLPFGPISNQHTVAEDDRASALLGDHKLDTVRNGYARILRALLHRRWIAVVVVLASVGMTLSFFSLKLIHTTFIPPENTGLFSMNISLPPGTPL
ncbi:MAG: hypothetical protein C7B43_11635 [Sulfobacillus benefaciens]|uniref:Uncharacterized protein n=1 Tax=Sulfobacillus benefaciens TaxID=453960 RepID=A0A2T2WZE8_9FIRM|nr:MAG: hypothetical protein C7B43_11635 [Sulfobacillus benefaciens]